MADKSLDSHNTKYTRDHLPGHQNITPRTALDNVLATDPEEPIPYLGNTDHPASFDLTKIVQDPRKEVDAQIIECDRSGKFRFRSYDKHGLHHRLSTARVIEAKPEEQLTLREAVELKYGNLKEESFPGDSDRDTSGEPFANFTPLFMGPFYRNQYMYKLLELKSKCYEAFNNNPVAHRIPNIITQFTLGKGVTAVCKSDKTRKVWDDFATLNKIGTSMSVGLTRAGSRLRMWSNQLSVDGEMLWQFVPTKKGLKIKYIDSATILDVVTNPEDIDDVYYYHQQYCLVGDTKISLIDGSEPTIKEMTDRYERGDTDMWVYSYDHDKGKIVPGHVTWASNQGEKECWEVELDNGKKVVASYDHPFLMRDGSYVWASNLAPGASLMPLYRRSGYEELYQPDGKWEHTHQAVIRETQGHVKTKGTVVHHKDGNRSNNHPDNLEVMSHADHTRLTMEGYWNDDSAAGDYFRANRAKKSSRVAKANWRDPEYRKNHIRAVKDSWVYNRDVRVAALKKTWTDPEVRAKRLAQYKDPEKIAKRTAKLRRTCAFKRSKKKFAKKETQVLNHKVVSVRPVGKRVVYDLTVDKHHNFALACGVFTHNTTAFQQFLKDNIPGIKYIIRDIPASQVLHIKINTYENEKRGRSDLASIIGWLKRLKDLVNANVIKAYFQACYTWDYTIDGSPATVTSIANSYKNIVPTPGSSYFHNKNILRTPNVPTGGTGAASDNDMVGLMNLISMGCGLPPAYLIGSMSMNRASVLTETEPSTKFFFERQSVWDETLHAFYDRLSRWHYDQTGEMLDESIEFSFPTINAVERNAYLQTLGTMRDNKWFANKRCADLAAKEFSVTSYNFEDEQKEILKESKEALQRELEKNKAQSAAQSHLSLWQNILSDTAAKEEQGMLGYNVGQASPEQAQQDQANSSQDRQMQIDKHQQDMKQGGKPNDKQKSGLTSSSGNKKSVKSPGHTKNQSTSGGVSEQERARTSKSVKSNAHD